MNSSTNYEDSIPPVDSVSDYLGVSVPAVPELAGEIRHRSVDTKVTESKDNLLNITHGIFGYDPDLATQERTEEDIVIDAEFVLSVTRSSETGEPPELYNELATDVKSFARETEQEDRLTSVSIGSFPGTIHHHLSERSEERYPELNVLWYAQSFPWGIIWWEFIYDPALSIGTAAQEHHEWLQQRKSRDWDSPSLGTKQHWSKANEPDTSELALFEGDISPLLSVLPSLEQTQLERIEGGFGSSSTSGGQQ